MIKETWVDAKGINFKDPSLNCSKLHANCEMNKKEKKEKKN